MNPNLDDILRECTVFRESFMTLMMATVSEHGQPDASYAPFVSEPDGSFLIYVSELSRHTANLRSTHAASVLLIEAEQDAKQLYARRRLTLPCQAIHIPRDDAVWDTILDRFKARFGNLVDVLRQMGDFHLYRLRPKGGTYVRGFAQAYELRGPDLTQMKHIRDQGHSSGAPSTQPDVPS